MACALLVRLHQIAVDRVIRLWRITLGIMIIKRRLL